LFVFSYCCDYFGCCRLLLAFIFHSFFSLPCSLPVLRISYAGLATLAIKRRKVCACSAKRRPLV
jgi:hypothetical protein